MKYGIIGATGTLGRVLVRTLTEDDNNEIIALVRRANADLGPKTQECVAPNGAFDSEQLGQVVENADVVINLAARNPGGQDVDLRHLDEFLTANAHSPALVAAECAAKNKPLLQFSTVAVYETHAYKEGRELDENSTLPSLDEESTRYFEEAVARVRESVANRQSPAESLARLSSLQYPQHASVYGLSKLIGERIVVQGPVRSCCVRLSDVFGPGHESRGVVIDHLRAAQGPSDTPDVDLGFRTTAYLIDIQDVMTATRALATKLHAGDPLPPIVNLVGHCLDEPKLAAALERACRARLPDGRSFAVRPPQEEKFDRRYASKVLGEVLPQFALTPFDASLRRTWDALHHEW